MKRYKVIANDDAMKYQVVHISDEDCVCFENDGKSEADEVCNLMNVAFEEGRSSMVTYMGRLPVPPERNYEE